MALRRSLIRLGELKPGVQPHLELWWKKKPGHGTTDGMVTQQISPFELTPFKNVFDNLKPSKLADTFPNIWDIGPAIVILVGTVYGADWYFEHLAHTHRD